MSTLIDERIVSMGFDNKNFEQNVKTSMNTLDRLKEKLNFSGVANSLNDSLESVSTKGLVSSLSRATQGFTTMEVIAISAINNITNKIVDMGLELVKSLSTDNISDGWTKYGQKVKSVGTLMAQTLRNEDGSVMSEAEKIANINKNLELLTFYADETSYSFSDMLNNITKFTGAGVSLDDATEAMMGSSNWAALSGQDAATAARVQLQLSQAMGVGAMTLIDWKSIQNANMATEEFKQHAIDAAVAQGTLQQSIDGTYQTLDGTDVSVSNFRNTLSKRWFTSDILLDVLKTYGGAVGDIYDFVQDNMDVTLSSDAILMMGDELDAFALKAYKAAQESRTLSDALAAVKETIGTVYTGMFESVFGVYDEAKQVWTDLVAVLYKMVVRDLVVKAKILDAWNGLGGRMDLFDRTEDDNGAFWNLLEAIQTIKDTIKKAWNIVFPLSEMKEEGAMIADIGKKLKDFTEKLKEMSKGWILTTDEIEVFTNILTGVFSIVKGFGKLIGAIWRGISPLVAVFKELVSSILHMLSGAGSGLTDFMNTTSMFEIIGNVLFSVSTVIADALRVIGYWFSVVFSQLQTNPSVQNGMNSILNFFRSLPVLIVNMYNDVKASSLGDIFTSITTSVNTFYETIKEAYDNIGTVDTSGLDVLGDESLKKLNPLYEVLKGIGSIVVGLVSVLKSLIPVIGQAFLYIGMLLQKIGDGMSKIFNGAAGVGLDKILDVAFWVGILFVMNELKDMFYLFIGGFNEMMASVGGSLEGLEFKLKSQAIRNIAISVLILAAAMFLMAAIPEKDFIRAASVMAVIAAVMIYLSGVFKKFMPVMKRISINSLLAAAEMTATAHAMIDFGKAMLLFVASVWILSTIPADKMAAGLTGLISIAAVMVIFAKTISSNTKGFFGSALALLAMAVSISILAVSFKIIATMSTEGITKGITAMSAMVGLMIIFSLSSRYVKKANITALGLITFSAALVVAAVSLKILGSMSWEQLAIGMSAISGLAAILMTMAVLSKYVKKSIITSIGILTLGVGLSVFAGSLAILGTLSWDGILKSLSAIGIVIGVMAGISTIGSSSILLLWGLGAGLVAFSIGLMVYAKAMRSLGDIDPKIFETAIKMLFIMLGLMVVLTNQFGIGGILVLGALGVSLTILGAGLIVFGKGMKSIGSIKVKELIIALLVLVVFLPIVSVLGVTLAFVSPLLILFAIALTAVGIALMVFGAGIGAVGHMKFWSIAKGIMVMVVALALLSVATYFLAPLVPTLFGIALAMLVFGAAVLFLGAGLALITATLATFGGIAFRAIVEFTDAIIMAMPKIFEAIDMIVIGIIGVLTEAIPKFVDMLIALFDKILPKIVEYTPVIVDVIVNLIDHLLQALADKGPTISTNIVALFVVIMNTISAQMDAIVNSLVNMVVSFVDSLGEKIPELLDAVGGFVQDMVDAMILKIEGLVGLVVDAAAGLIVAIIDGLGTAIEDNADDIRDAMNGFMDHMLNAMLIFWGIESPSTKMIELAGYLIEGLVQGVSDGALKVIKAGKTIVTNLKKGVKDNWSTLSGYITEKVNWIKEKFEGLPDDFLTIGKDIIDGMVEGLGEKWSDLEDFIIGLAELMPVWMKVALGIHSPSKVFAEIGGYIGEGMANGIGDSSSMVKDEAEEMAQGAIDGVEGSGINGMMTKLYNALMGDFEDGIVIRPVMDLTDVYAGRDQIYSMMKDLNGVGLNGSNDLASKVSIRRASNRDSSKTQTKQSSAQSALQDSLVISNTFNITGNNSKNIANEVAKTLQNQIDRRQVRWAR